MLFDSGTLIQRAGCPTFYGNQTYKPRPWFADTYNYSEETRIQIDAGSSRPSLQRRKGAFSPVVPS